MPGFRWSRGFSVGIRVNLGFGPTSALTPIEPVSRAYGQRFSWWMTQLLHRHSAEMDFDTKRQIAEIDYVTGSEAAMTSLAENYAGLPID